jgi:replicative superfamily II helicase
MIRIVGLSATLPNYLEVGIRFFGCVLVCNGVRSVWYKVEFH